jgi:epoxyqueuosine reductase
MDELLMQSSRIKAEARKLGFDGCGISHAGYLQNDSICLLQWLREKFHGKMAYMENYFEKRVDPTKLVENSRSVISVILNYYPSRKQQDFAAPVIAKYSYGEDYHDVIRKRLYRLLQFINSEIAQTNGRAFVDSAPVLERAWAAKSGLGWIGKNTNLISPETGSFFFIGSLIVDIPLCADKPIGDLCGDCDLCIRACPTKAIVRPRILDARRCISYLTIENKQEIDQECRDKLRNRVFGCDICQDVCPWNHKAIPHRVKELEPLPGVLEMTQKDWYQMDEQKFAVIFKKSAIKRTGFKVLKRNLDYLAGKNFTD